MTKGVIVDQSEVVRAPGYQDAWLASRYQETGSLQRGFDCEGVSGGRSWSGRPTALRSFYFKGDIIRSFYNDFYDRIYFFPPILDFKAISGSAVQTLDVWNAFTESVTLKTILSKDAEGVAISGPELPRTMRGLELITYTVTVTAVGPSTVDAEFDFEIDKGGEPVTVPTIVNVRGNRSKFLPYRPDWQSGYKVTYDFKTDITVSRTGREQRRMLNESPDKSIEYNIGLMSGEETRSFYNRAYSWRGKVYILPELSRMTMTVSPMPAGGRTVQVGTVPEWLNARATVVLYNGYRMSLRTVLSVNRNNGVINFAESDDGAWRIGTWISCTQPGYLDDQISATFTTRDTRDLVMKFKVKPAADIPDDVGVGENWFDGREIFTWIPSAKDGVTHDFINPSEELYFGYGTYQRFNPVDFPQLALSATFLNLDRTKSDKILQFCLRQGGRLREFWLKSWGDDMELVGMLQAGTKYIRVKDQEIYELANASTVFGAVQIEGINGFRGQFRISGVERISDEIGQDTLIRFYNEIPYDIPKAAILKIGWLFLVRFASDQFVQEWINMDFSRMKLNFQTIEILPGN